MKALASRFVEESSLELHSFLCAPLADKLRTGLVEKDDQDGLGPGRATRIPPHTAGSGGAWRIRGPPHKWRYGALRPLEGSGPKMAVSPRWAHARVDDAVRSLQDALLPSAAFRAWLAAVSRLESWSLRQKTSWSRRSSRTASRSGVSALAMSA